MGRTRRGEFRLKQRTPKLLGQACLLLACAAVLYLASCGGGPPAPPAAPPPAATRFLTTAEVQAVVDAAAGSVDVPLVIAVTDRVGNVLAVFRKPAAPATATGNFGVTVDSAELVVALARTAAFFSNSQAPLSSRTVRFISGVHFPPGVAFTPNAALYGIENTNRGCPLNVTFDAGKAVPPAESLSGGVGLGIITGKADTLDSDAAALNPGGVPLFKNGELVGGVGVVADRLEVAEFAAFRGAGNAGSDISAVPADPLPAPGAVIVDGIALPFVAQTTQPSGTSPEAPSGAYDVGPSQVSSTPPEGDLVSPVAGAGGLTQAEVRTIIDQAIATAQATRAVIRLPLGSRTRMAIAVADTNGNILGLHRMPDSTVFSLDVAVAKARNVFYFSTAAGAADLPGLPPGTAVTNRTINFGAQPFFPPGIDGSGAGPFFDLYLSDLANPCTQGSQPADLNQNGVVFFPGSVPLYKDGVLVGGLGISGDGVEQDDFVSAGGAAGFEAPPEIRADQTLIRGVRMPYLKFPRNPTD